MTSSFDTNVLVYASDPSAGPFQSRSLDLLGRAMTSSTHVLLLQTLVEFSSVAVRKLHAPVPDILTLISSWRRVLPVAPATEEDLFAGLNAVRKHGLSFWDSVLWAAARRVGVQYLLSQDFQDGRRLDGVQFVDPFNPANDALINRILPA